MSPAYKPPLAPHHSEINVHDPQYSLLPSPSLHSSTPGSLLLLPSTMPAPALRHYMWLSPAHFSRSGLKPTSPPSLGVHSTIANLALSHPACVVHLFACLSTSKL